MSMRTDEFDLDTDGQMTIEDLFQPPERLFAVSRIFARARKEMSLAEQKTLVYALSELRFTEVAKSCYVRLNKKVLANVLGIHSDPDHLSVDLFNNIRLMDIHSHIEFRDQDRGLYVSGALITSIACFRNFVRIRFNEDYITLFTGLTKDYITMWSTDIFQMGSKRSVQFYELLRQLTDTRLEINEHGWGVRQFKEMFGIPKDGKGSYMRKDGHFDRPAFEKYVLQPLCEDLKSCKMIHLLVQPDGKYYEKVKIGNRVVGYRFYWTFSSHPRVASAEEVQQIQQRVDKNPKILKIAKDMLEGERRAYQPEAEGTDKKTRGRAGGNMFNQFEQNSYDYDKLEKELLARDGFSDVEDDYDELPF